VRFIVTFMYPCETICFTDIVELFDFVAILLLLLFHHVVIIYFIMQIYDNDSSGDDEFVVYGYVNWWC
jgi:hypothetical protein